MKCQHCGQNEANFFQHSNINGQITETHLCSECAEMSGVMQSFVMPVPRVFGEFFGRPEGMPFVGFMPFIGFEPRFAARGLAAPEETHTASRQTAEVDEEMRKLREINILREQMKSAAASEEFEKAMFLREEIKRLEA